MTWENLRERLDDVAAELDSITYDAAGLVGQVKATSNPQYDSGDPRHSQAKAAQFAASVTACAGTVQRLAQSIQEPRGDAQG